MSNAPPGDEMLIGIRELSVRTGLPVGKLYEATANRTIPHYKIGKYVRFRWGEVEAWLAQHRVEPVDRP